MNYELIKHQSGVKLFKTDKPTSYVVAIEIAGDNPTYDDFHGKPKKAYLFSSNVQGQAKSAAKSFFRDTINAITDRDALQDLSGSDLLLIFEETIKASIGKKHSTLHGSMHDIFDYNEIKQELLNRMT